MEKLKKFWPMVLPVLTAVFAAFSPQLQEMIASNPEIAAVLASFYAVIASALPSPVEKNPTDKK